MRSERFIFGPSSLFLDSPKKRKIKISTRILIAIIQEWRQFFLIAGKYLLAYLHNILPEMSRFADRTLSELLPRLGGRRQDAVHSQVAGLRGIVVVPIACESDHHRGLGDGAIGVAHICAEV